MMERFLCIPCSPVKTHESRAVNARRSRASAAASRSFGSLSRIWTTDRRLPVSAAAWASADGMGVGSPPGDVNLTPNKVGSLIDEAAFQDAAAAFDNLHQMMKP